jgi:hypothetical protein
VIPERFSVAISHSFIDTTSPLAEAVEMGTISQIGEFDGGKEDVVSYLERFEMFLDANDIEAPGKKRSVFLSTVGAQTYKILRSLSNNKPLEKTYEELKQLLTQHLQPRPNVIAQRYKFFERYRAPNESVSEYLAELGKLSEFCEFGDKLDEYLRDRLVCGIRSEKILQKLLSIQDLTLKNATSHAIAIETACKDALEIQGRSGQGHFDGGIHKLYDKVGSASSGSRRECYRCGDTRHLADTCPFRTRECFACKKMGHVRKMCKSSEPERRDKRRTDARTDPKEKGCHNVEVSEEEAIDSLETWSLYPLVDLDFARNAPAVIRLDVNNHRIAMELDTGAAVSVMSLSAYHRVKKVDDVLSETSLKIRTYTGDFVRPAGVGVVDVGYRGENCRLPITVVKGNVPTLLGRDWLKTLKLDWGQLFPPVAKVNLIEGVVPRQIGELMERFPEVISDKLGCLKDYKVHIPVSEDVRPRFFKARPVPYSLRARVEEQLDKMEEQGIWKK